MNGLLLKNKNNFLNLHFKDFLPAEPCVFVASSIVEGSSISPFSNFPTFILVKQKEAFENFKKDIAKVSVYC